MEAHYLEPRIFGGVGGNSVADTKTPVFPFVIGWGAMERISEGTRHVPSESCILYAHVFLQTLPANVYTA
jgi:hypothetical protein